MSALENIDVYAPEAEIFAAAIADGFTPPAAQAYAEELTEVLERESFEQQSAEIAAENAWLHAAENAGYDDDRY